MISRHIQQRVRQLVTSIMRPLAGLGIRLSLAWAHQVGNYGASTITCAWRVITSTSDGKNSGSGWL